MEKTFEFQIDQVIFKNEIVQRIKQAIEQNDVLCAGCDQCLKKKRAHCLKETQVKLTKDDFEEILKTSQDLVDVLKEVKTGNLTNFSGIRNCETLLDYIQDRWTYNGNSFEKDLVKQLTIDEVDEDSLNVALTDALNSILRDTIASFEKDTDAYKMIISLMREKF